ncbi:MAG TPA: hypothetical protein VF316_03120 [Polyangiaceae bacterium]
MTPLSVGRSLLNATVERIARTAFPELAGAPLREVARRMGDVRDVLDGLPVAMVSVVQRERVEAAARDAVATLEGPSTRPDPQGALIPSALPARGGGP